MYLDTFCLLYCVRVCVCVCFRKQGGEGVISRLLLCVLPSTAFPLCRLRVCVYMCACGKVCVGVFHGTVPTLHSTPPPLHPFPLLHLHLFSLIYPSILLRPSVAAAPLSLSITPAVMRLNLSVSTGHAHARTLHTHTLQSAAAAHTHTHNHPLKRAHYSPSHALNQHKPDTTVQLAHLASLPTPHTLTQTHLACDQGLSLYSLSLCLLLSGGPW